MATVNYEQLFLRAGRFYRYVIGILGVVLIHLGLVLLQGGLVFLHVLKP
jgi:hypothetical protein